jgi:hypothetical protein
MLLIWSQTSLTCWQPAQPYCFATVLVRRFTASACSYDLQQSGTAPGVPVLLDTDQKFFLCRTPTGDDSNGIDTQAARARPTTSASSGAAAMHRAAATNNPAAPPRVWAREGRAPPVEKKGGHMREGRLSRGEDGGGRGGSPSRTVGRELSREKGRPCRL